MDSKPRLASCLKMLGISPTLETFDERKLLQKLVFLVKEFGLDFGFSYGWYIHGPYSPDLTRTLYEMAGSDAVSYGELSKSEKAKIDSLMSALGKDLHSSDSLELIVSVLYLRKKGASDEEVVSTIRRVKPYFSNREVQESLLKATELAKAAKSSRRI